MDVILLILSIFGLLIGIFAWMAPPSSNREEVMHVKIFAGIVLIIAMGTGLSVVYQRQLVGTEVSHFIYRIDQQQCDAGIEDDSIPLSIWSHIKNNCIPACYMEIISDVRWTVKEGESVVFRLTEYNDICPTLFELRDSEEVKFYQQMLEG